MEQNKWRAANTVSCWYQGGLLLLHLVDIFGLSVMSLYFIVCFETIVISWVYGKSLAQVLDCFCRDSWCSWPKPGRGNISANHTFIWEVTEHFDRFLRRNVNWVAKSVFIGFYLHCHGLFNSLWSEQLCRSVTLQVQTVSMTTLRIWSDTCPSPCQSTAGCSSRLSPV